MDDKIQFDFPDGMTQDQKNRIKEKCLDPFIERPRCTAGESFIASMFHLNFLQDKSPENVNKLIEEIGAKKFNKIVKCRHCFSNELIKELTPILVAVNALANTEDKQIERAFEQLRKLFPNKIFTCRDRTDND